MTMRYQCDNCNRHCLLSANKSLDEKIPIKCPWPNANSTDGVWKAPEQTSEANKTADHMALTKILVDALSFYADPDTYFAIGFFPDPPCGEFIDDFDMSEKTGTVKPGARARKVLADFYLALSISQKGPEHEAEEVRSDAEST